MADRSNSSVGEVRDIPLGQLEIGKAQVRVKPNKDIDDLALSIKKVGLLEPIVVTPTGPDKYEILTGQRRFLAHVQLGYQTIKAVVIDRKIDETEARVISLTENLVRRDLSRKELIDACTDLYKRYGTLRIVAEETGLSPRVVSEYVKYDQLVDELKGLVDGGSLDVRTALQAQKAASTQSGDVDVSAAVKYAKELAPMSGQQRKRFVQLAEEDPDASPEEKIERGRKQPVLKQIVVTLEQGLHSALQRYAKDEGVSQDEAAATLLEDALSDRGLVGGE